MPWGWAWTAPRKSPAVRGGAGVAVLSCHGGQHDARGAGSGRDLSGPCVVLEQLTGFRERWAAPHAARLPRPTQRHQRTIQPPGGSTTPDLSALKHKRRITTPSRAPRQPVPAASGTDGGAGAPAPLTPAGMPPPPSRPPRALHPRPGTTQGMCMYLDVTLGTPNPGGKGPLFIYQYDPNEAICPQFGGFCEWRTLRGRATCSRRPVASTATALRQVGEGRRAAPHPGGPGAERRGSQRREWAVCLLRWRRAPPVPYQHCRRPWRVPHTLCLSWQRSQGRTGSFAPHITHVSICAGCAGDSVRSCPQHRVPSCARAVTSARRCVGARPPAGWHVCAPLTAPVHLDHQAATARNLS